MITYYFANSIIIIGMHYNITFFILTSFYNKKRYFIINSFIFSFQMLKFGYKLEWLYEKYSKKNNGMRNVSGWLYFSQCVW